MPIQNNPNQGLTLLFLNPFPPALANPGFFQTLNDPRFKESTKPPFLYHKWDWKNRTFLLSLGFFPSVPLCRAHSSPRLQRCSFVLGPNFILEDLLMKLKQVPSHTSLPIH